MPFDPDITTLIRLRQQMGASLGRYTPGRRENRNLQAQIVMGLGEITPVVLNRDMFEEEVFTIEDFSRIWVCTRPCIFMTRSSAGSTSKRPLP